MKIVFDFPGANTRFAVYALFFFGFALRPANTPALTFAAFAFAITGIKTIKGTVEFASAVTALVQFLQLL